MMNTAPMVMIATRLPMPAGMEMDAREWRVLVDSVFPAAKSAAAVMMPAANVSA